MRVAAVLFLFLFLRLETHAQSRTIKGLVLSEDLTPLSHISIYLKDSIEIGLTNSDGRYEITVPTHIDSISYLGVGYERLFVSLNSGCSLVNIIMILHGTYDFMSPEKMDRQRRRYYDRVNKLYPLAVERGLFAAEPSCYAVLFQRYAPGMRQRHKEWLRQKAQLQPGL
jgi:hypothetical protein